MALDMVLKTLEERIEKMVKAYGEACTTEGDLRDQIAKLEGKVGELESSLENGAVVAEKAEELERQNQQFTERLEGVIASIDSALQAAEDSTES